MLCKGIYCCHVWVDTQIPRSLLTKCPPLPPSSLSYAPYHPLPPPIPQQLPHVRCPPDFDGKLPEPLLVVRFPTSGLVRPVRLQGQAGNVRQAVTHIAQKKQWSAREKKKNHLAWMWLKCTFLKKFTCWPLPCCTPLSWHAFFMYLFFYYYYLSSIFNIAIIYLLCVYHIPLYPSILRLSLCLLSH